MSTSFLNASNILKRGSKMGRRKKTKKEPVREKALKALELPRDIILGMPKITVTGDKEVLIENYKGIVEYENTGLKINTELGIVSILGSDFDITAVTDDEIEIEGKISKIDFSF
jgi:sporulation protein YqfC